MYPVLRTSGVPLEWILCCCCCFISWDCCSRIWRRFSDGIGSVAQDASLLRAMQWVPAYARERDREKQWQSAMRIFSFQSSSLAIPVHRMANQPATSHRTSGNIFPYGHHVWKFRTSRYDQGTHRRNPSPGLLLSSSCSPSA